jgi:hypothetical protein
MPRSCLEHLRNRGDIMSNEPNFEVGSKYENMKGVYEVISIHKDSMMIRWDDGSEIATSADLQKRIIERMAYESKMEQSNESVKVKKTVKAKKNKAQPLPLEEQP